MPKALIDDTNPGGHGSTVKDYFTNDAPDGWTVEVRNRGPTGIVDDAIDEGAKVIIRSLTGVWSYKSEWDRAWGSGILVVHGHGSNSNVELDDPPRIFSAIVVGGESPAGGLEDERSFGPGLEIDAEAHDGATEESWATPTVAALMARLYDHHKSSDLTEQQVWLRARANLRQLALKNNPEDQWSPERGFGLIYSYNNADSDFQFLIPDPQPPFDVQVTSKTGLISALWERWNMGTAPTTRIKTPGPDGELDVDATSEDFYNMGTSAQTLQFLTLIDGTTSAVDTATRPIGEVSDVDQNISRNSKEVSTSVPTPSGATTYTLERERLGRGFTQQDEASQPSFKDEPPDPYKPYRYRIKSDAPSLGGDWTSRTRCVRGNPAFPAASFKV